MCGSGNVSSHQPTVLVNAGSDKVFATNGTMNKTLRSQGGICQYIIILENIWVIKMVASLLVS